MQGLCELAMAQRKGSHRVPPLIRSSVARSVHHLANFEPSSPHACCAQEREERRERCPPTHRPHQNTPADVLDHNFWASGADRGPHRRCAHSQPPHSGQRERPRSCLKQIACHADFKSICFVQYSYVIDLHDYRFFTRRYVVRTVVCMNLDSVNKCFTGILSMSISILSIQYPCTEYQYIVAVSRGSQALPRAGLRGRAGARLRRDEGIFRGRAE
jgi:hypothetical protein